MRIVIVIAGLAACAGRGSSQSPPAEAAAAASPGQTTAASPGQATASCATEANALAASLRTAATGAWATFEAALVDRPELPTGAPPDAPVLELGVADTLFEGQALGPAALREHLTAVYDKRDERHALEPDRPDPAVVSLYIDRRVPWSRVVEAWQAAHDAGMRAPVFVFAAAPPPPPPRAPIDDELDAIPDGQRATGYAALLTREIAPCPTLVRVFDQLATGPGDDKTDRLIDGLVPALVACQCAVDVPDLRAVLWRVLVAPRPVTSIAFDPAAPAATLALPATTPWSEASVRFTPDLRNATLRVRGR